MVVPMRWRRRPSPTLPPHYKKKKSLLPRILSKRLFGLLVTLAVLALLPPLFFHLRLRRFHQMRSRKCGWLGDPPLVCAHGGDSSKAVPNTMDAYRVALSSRVDCIEIDISRSLDGVLFALHDRDLQRMSGNSTAKVGYMSKKEIKGLDAGLGFAQEFHNQEVPTVEDALRLISNSVRQVILDAKVGPPSYEKGLAEDILSVGGIKVVVGGYGCRLIHKSQVKRSHCRNCLIWAKDDLLVRDVIQLSQDVVVGYIVLKDPSTGTTSNLLRIKGAGVVGVYRPLIDGKLMRILHGNGKKVYAWTVDDADSMRRMLFDHVDAIVTSNPSLLQDLMQDLKTECLEEGFSLP